MSFSRLFVLTALSVFVADAVCGLHPADGDDQDREVVVSLKDVPDGVKATMLTELLREVKGLELEKVEAEVEGGRVVYDAEFEFGDTEMELEIDASGKLLNKKVSREDGDDEEDEDDDGDDGSV